jgi:hypothetical protein
MHVRASEILLQHSRVLKLDLSLEKFPNLLLVVGVTSKLEIIDVDAEDSS